MIEYALVWSSSIPDPVNRPDHEGTARSSRDRGALMTEVIEHDLIRFLVQLTPKRLPPAKCQRRQRDGTGNCITPESKYLDSVLMFMVV